MESNYHNKSKNPFLLKLNDIDFNYGNLQVLKDIDLTVYPSENHVIVGEHGAGKSSLCFIISGALKPRSGTIIFNGKQYIGFTIKHARNIGIEMVNQQNQLYDDFSVAQNIFVNSKFIYSLPVVNKGRLIKEAERLFIQYNFDISPIAILKDLTLSDRVLVDIMKHIYSKPRLLILDEALEKLSSETLVKVLKILDQLKKEGMSILCISHRIDDIYHFADTVSIIKNGCILITDKTNNIDKINLIKLAYTQITKKQPTENLNKEFYNLLKYNEAILLNLPVNLMVIDNDKIIKLINNYGKRYFGLVGKDINNLSLRNLFSEDNEETLNIVENALSSKTEENTFYNVSLNIDGKKTKNNIKIYPIYDESFFIGNIIIIEDITEQEELRAQLILSEKLASMGLLAAGVAHEINNPLEIIYNYLNFLKYNVSDNSLADTIKNLDEEFRYIAHIVSNLITFSDDKVIRKENVDVNALISNIIGLIKYSAQYKNIDISFVPRNKAANILADKKEIKQVILNLFKNSFEAMPTGGNIYITTEKIIKDKMDMIAICFKDTGSGIKGKNLYDIFLPFYSTKKGEGSNLGLGLSIIYGIIKKYDGTITVENLQNSGCLFKITFPHSDN